MPSDDGSLAFLEMVIGEPYNRDGLNCWEAVRRYYQVVHNVELPPVLIAPSRMKELIGMMELRKTYAGWVEVPQPQHAAIVFMTKNGHEVSNAACHAGIWLDFDGGGILHTDDPHGVVFETLGQIKLHNWGDFSYYVRVSPTP